MCTKNIRIRMLKNKFCSTNTCHYILVHQNSPPSQSEVTRYITHDKLMATAKISYLCRLNLCF